MTASTDDPRTLESTAIEAARAASEILRARFRETSGIRVETKGLHDFVTEVDREAEAAVLAVIRRHHPRHAVMAEEGSPDAHAEGLRWIVDPLDGTTNFIHGVSTFATSVAVENAGGILAGAIHDPYHGETFHARLGGGAFLDGRPIRCRDPEDTHDALIATGFPFRELSRLDGYLATFDAFVRMTAGIRRAGSAALDLAFTACGRYDGFWEVGLSRWDIAAGALLVREAGGIVTDVGGGDAFLDRGDIVAAGPRLHGRMVGVTRQHLG